jgi:thymidylate synthase
LYTIAVFANFYTTLIFKVENIEDFTFDDFEVVDYKPHPKITMEMAV